MKNYTLWLKTAAIFQFIAAAIHIATLFVSPPPNNADEKQLYNLMDTYKFDLGAGFHKTMGDLTLALSSCFCLVTLMSGLMSLYLLRKKVDPQVMKGVININLFIFGILFVLVTAFTFLLPIINIGLVVLFLILARATVSSKT